MRNWKKILFWMVFVFMLSQVRLQAAQLDAHPRLKKWLESRGAHQPEGSVSSPENKRIVEVKGTPRSYYVFVPEDYSPQKKYPVIFAFHGGGGNAESILKMTRLADFVTLRQFILVVPNGTGPLPDQEVFQTWNAGNCCGAAFDKQVDDTVFVKAIVEQISRNYAIDASRIFFTGMSNGGMISHRLACELSEMTSGIAPVVGALNFELCKPKRPIPVLLFNGTGDQHVLYEGGKPLKTIDRRERVDRPVAYAVNFWIQNNGCNPQPQTDKFKDIIVDRYSECKEDAEVILYTIIDGGHAWPGGKKGSRRGDEPTHSIEATQIILDFFLNRK